MERSIITWLNRADRPHTFPAMTSTPRNPPGSGAAPSGAPLSAFAAMEKLDAHGRSVKIRAL